MASASSFVQQGNKIKQLDIGVSPLAFSQIFLMGRAMKETLMKLKILVSTLHWPTNTYNTYASIMILFLNLLRQTDTWHIPHQVSTVVGEVITSIVDT